MQTIFISTIALLLAGTMGFAIQRGATCTVAAVDELVNKRRARRLISMLEASLWVVGGLLIARALGAFPVAPRGYALSAWTLAGAALLGAGAFLNQACVFGAIARLGNGEWSYLFTPLGFYAGCVSVAYLTGVHVQPTPRQESPVLQAPVWLLWAAIAFMAWRLLTPLLRLRGAAQPADEIAARVWAPHAATAVIGITFFFLLLLMGAWAYTDVLAELAHSMSNNLPVRLALLFALLAGAVLGGWTAGRFRPTAITAARLARCFAGGLLMGWGSLLIPGSNDGLILLGMPLLWPYAWAAFLTMCLSIAAAMVLPRIVQRSR